jgi:outer membrane protein assembly factor BamB
MAGGYTVVEIRNDSMFFSERTPGIRTSPVWDAVALRGPIRRPFTEDSPRPDFRVNRQYPNVSERWRIPTGYTIASSPARSGDKVIVGDASGTVRAIRLADGSTAWTFHAGSAVYSTPAAAEDTVVFAATDGIIYALDSRTGAERWQYRTAKAIVASPVIHRGTVFIGSSDGQFRALELSTGKLRWEHAGVGGFVETRPLVTDGLVIFGAWDEHLYALDESTGTLRWKWSGNRPGVLYSPAACWPVSAHGTVFVVAPDRMMTAIDVAGGRTLWRTGVHQVRETIGCSGDGERVYIRTMQDSILALSTRAPGPETVWSVNAAFGYDINSAMIIEQNDTIFYGTKNGFLYAFDRHTGRTRWIHRTGPALLNTPVPLPDGGVVVTDADGMVIRIDVR